MGPHTRQPLKSRALPHCWAPVPPHITSAEKPETGNPHLGYSPSGDIRLLGYPPSAIHLPRYSPSGIFTSWDIHLPGCSPSGIFASGVFTFWDVHLLQYSPSGIFTFRIFTFWISTFWDIHVPGYSPSGTCAFWDMRLLGYSSSGMFTFWGTHPWAQAFGIFAFWDIRFRDIQAPGVPDRRLWPTLGDITAKRPCHPQPHSNTQPAHCCHQKRPRRSRSATLADSR